MYDRAGAGHYLTSDAGTLGCTSQLQALGHRLLPVEAFRPSKEDIENPDDRSNGTLNEIIRPSSHTIAEYDYLMEVSGDFRPSSSQVCFFVLK